MRDGMLPINAVISLLTECLDNELVLMESRGHDAFREGRISGLRSALCFLCATEEYSKIELKIEIARRTYEQRNCSTTQNGHVQGPEGNGNAPMGFMENDKTKDHSEGLSSPL